MHMHELRKIYLFPFFLIFLEIAIFLSNDMYLPSMPAIAQDLALNQQQIQHTLAVWFLGSSSLQFILGPISDCYGRRSVVLCGGVVFILSSAACALATSLPVMLTARFIQGSTICAVLVAGGAAIHESFNTKMAIKIFAFINAVTILAPAFGPLIGAIIVQYASWRMIFWLLAVLGLLATILLILFMPESNKLKHNMHLKTIFTDYKLIIKNKDFMRPSISYSLLLAIFFIWMFEAPFLMMQNYGTSNLYYGVSQAFIFGCFFIGAALTRLILNKYNLNKLIKMAASILVIGTCSFVLIAHLYDDMLLSIICMMIISTGSSMLFAPLTRIAIDASTQPMGRRTAVSSTMISLFGALTGWLVSVIDIHNLSNIAGLIALFVILALLFLIKIGRMDFDLA